jgi:hypothetical protein
MFLFILGSAIAALLGVALAKEMSLAHVLRWAYLELRYNLMGFKGIVLDNLQAGYNRTGKATGRAPAFYLPLLFSSTSSRDYYLRLSRLALITIGGPIHYNWSSRQRVLRPVSTCM